MQVFRFIAPALLVLASLLLPSGGSAPALASLHLEGPSASLRSAHECPGETRSGTCETRCVLTGLPPMGMSGGNAPSIGEGNTGGRAYLLGGPDPGPPRGTI